MEESSSATDVELTDTAFDATPGEVQQRIEDEVASFLQLLRECEEPAMSVTSRANNNAIFCKREKHIRLGTTTVKRKLSDGKRYQGMWKVLQACYALMKERKTVNQRELYYLNTDVVLLLYIQCRCSQHSGNATTAYATALLFSTSPAMCWGSQQLQRDMFLGGNLHFAFPAQIALLAWRRGKLGRPLFRKPAVHRVQHGSAHAAQIGRKTHPGGGEGWYLQTPRRRQGRRAS